MVAADAGPMGIEWIGGVVWRWAGAAQRGRTESTEREIVVDQASWLVVDEREERKEEIYCPRRHKRTGGAETPKTFVMLIVLSYGSRLWKSLTPATYTHEARTPTHFAFCWAVVSC